MHTFLPLSIDVLYLVEVLKKKKCFIIVYTLVHDKLNKQIIIINYKHQRSFTKDLINPICIYYIIINHIYIFILFYDNII